MKEMSATRGRRRAVVTWNIKLGAEDLLALDPALEGGQGEEVWKEPEPDQWSHFWTPVFSFLLCVVGYRDFQFPAWLPLKIIL